MPHQQALTWLEQQGPLMREKLIAWAKINSGSGNLVGLHTMAETLIDAFSSLPAAFQSIDLPPDAKMSDQGQWHDIELGQALLWRCRPQASQRVLLVGHMDTVFGPEHAFQTIQDHGARIQGPGVSDMKGGLLIMLYALLAWEQTIDCDKLGWDVLITPDEELGSPSSAELIAQLGSEHNMALVFEPALDAEGTFVSTRKGSGKLTLKAQGQSAHVGRAFDQGVNAICAMAEMIQHIHAWNYERESIIINIGRIHGGDAVNRVADQCLCHLDVRIQDQEDIDWFEEKLQTLINQANQSPGLRIEQFGGFKRPPKNWTPKTKKAFELLERAGKQLGIPIQYQATGGCCDGNNLSVNCGVIDTLGACGGGIHSSDEYIEVDSLVKRAQLTYQWLHEWSLE